MTKLKSLLFENDIYRNFVDELADSRGEPRMPKANDLQFGGDHYKTMPVEPWDVIDTWTLDQKVGYYRGNALKYIMRCGSKDDREQELRKAAHYIQKLLEVLEKK